jgi:predicted transcriptional regulator
MLGRAWSYRPTASRQEYTAQVMRDVLSEAGDQTGVLAHFVASMSESEAAALRALLRRRRVTGRP